ncbi:MAG: pyruvate dehydrogenase (acetyl-transferring) E1 component subunit alpha [Elusimicrobiota bacterium]
MPIETVAQTKTERIKILDVDGRVDRTLSAGMDAKMMRTIYEKMVQLRVFDERAFKLQRQGRLGTYPQILGQEATQIVPALCLRDKDWLVPTYRGHGAYFARGVRLMESLLYWGGDHRFGRSMAGTCNFDFAVPVGSHMTQAAGLAWAQQLRKSGDVVLCYSGDGGSSKGDFHEALTFAGVRKLPLVVLIENNQYAISTPRAAQCGAPTLAQKAHGYGIHGVQADGNDPLAVYRTVNEAVARGRQGGGASVVECVTYRMGHHTTADDANRYRSKEETESWRKKDPIERLRKYLGAEGLLTPADDERISREAELMVQAEVKAYEEFGPPNPLDMFAHNYAQAPWHLIEQRTELENLLEDKRYRNEIEELPAAEGRFP